jgi:mRNA-degrading endonuclease RelE of RelBE toxin-antitoxin system
MLAIDPNIPEPGRSHTTEGGLDPKREAHASYVLRPDAWQLRVGNYRVLYRFGEGVVFVLRVRFKGTKTTEEMGP